MKHKPSNHGAARRPVLIAFTAIAAAMIWAIGPASASGDAARGETLYQQCEDCHSIDENDVGPMHRGVVGRLAGTVPDYDYSPALRNAKIPWTEENLDKWLSNPQDFIPGARMFYNVKSPRDRADIIAFLRERAAVPAPGDGKPAQTSAR